MRFVSQFRAAALVGVLFVSVSAHAFTDALQPLIGVLQERSLSLSNATDKISKKQKRAADAAIRTLNRSTNSLASEIAGVGKALRPLMRAFPDDFTLIDTSIAAETSVSLSTAFASTLTDLQTQVSANTDDLQSLVDALPEGTVRDRVVAALASVQSILSTANTADLLAWIKALSTASKSEVKTAATVTRTLFGNRNLVSATVIINDQTESWRTADAGATWDRTSGTNSLILGGNQGTNTSFAIILDNYTGGTGTFTLSSGNFLDWRTSAYYFFDSGTVTISAISIPNHTIAGTLSFTASGWLGTVTMTNGLFNLREFSVQQ